MRVAFINICFSAVVALAAVGCSRDLGNYDYKEIEDPAITGISDSYTVLTHELLSIRPQCPSFADTTTWQFSWKAVDLADDRTVHNLGTGKDLDFQMTLPQGAYKLVFRATDIPTGVFWEKQSALQVSSTTSEGWMVLCDDSGRTRLDFISSVTGKTYCDIFHSNGYDGPRRLFWSYYADRESPFYLLSDSGATRLGKQEFSLEESYSLSYETWNGCPDDVQSITDGIGGKLMIAGGKAYYSDCIVDIGLFAPIEAGDAVFAPEVGVNRLTRNIIAPCYLLYDTLNGRFYGYAPALASEDLGHYAPLHEMNEMQALLENMDSGGQVLGSGFATFPQGYGYIYMESTIYDPSNSSMGMIYTIVSNGGRRIVFGTQLGELWGAVSIGDCAYAIGKSLYADISWCTDIEDAGHFAFSPLNAGLYYSVGGKIYYADLNSARPSSTLVADLGNEDICILKFQQYEKPENLQRQYDLVVGSLKGGEGTLRIYEGFKSGGDISKVEPEVYSGLGKIVDISYRELL